MKARRGMVLLVCIATIGMANSACGPRFQVGEVVDIPVEPVLGTQLTNGVILDQVSVTVGTFDRDAFNPWNRDEYRPGDRCLLVSGHMRNVTTNDVRVAFTVGGYDSHGEQVAWTLTSHHLPGHVSVTVPANSSRGFDVVINCEEAVRRLVFKPDTVVGIELTPTPGTLLAEGVELEEASVSVGTLQDSAFNVDNWRFHRPGDWCLLVRGSIRNTTADLLDVDLWIDGYDSEATRVASTLATGAQEGYLHMDVPGQHSQDFEVAVSWTDEMRSLHIVADSNDRMIPVPPFFPASILPNGLDISPPAGTHLTGLRGEPSELLLLTVAVDQVDSDREYFGYDGSQGSDAITAGDRILVISGSLQNRHRAYRKIRMFAEGYDVAGEQVSRTLDSAHLPGEIGLDIEPGQVGEFTLHMNMANSIASIRIYAYLSPILPP